MAGECIARRPHSKCGSKDNVQVFLNEDGSVSGYCFGCHTYIPDPLDGGEPPKSTRIKKTKEQIEEELREIGDLKSLDLDERNLKAAALEHFGIKVGYSEEDGKTPSFVHFPYTKDGEVVRYKTRILGEKKMWSVGLTNEVDLFGWEQAVASGAKRLIITEGEFDAVALTKILRIHSKAEYRDSQPVVVSIINGSGGAAKDISRNIQKIRAHFKDISLCFDQDDAGRQAVDAVCKLFPDFKVINLPGKDANYCLVHGITQGAYKAVTFNATKNKNTKLVWGYEVHEEAKEQAPWGLSWPWPAMTERTRGIRFGETIYIAAGEKMG